VMLHTCEHKQTLLGSCRKVCVGVWCCCLACWVIYDYQDVWQSWILR